MKSDRPFLEEAPEVPALEDALTRGGLGRRPRPEFATGDARFRAYVEYAPVALFVLDAEGRYVDFNPATLTLLGTDDTTLTTQTFLDTIAEEDRPSAEQHLATLQAAGQLEAEPRLRRADGTNLWVSLRATRLGDSRFLVVAEDITERKRAHQEMSDLNASLARQVADRAAELSATNQELEAFCYSVSHDLRAPVRAMDGFSQALMEDFGPQLPETGQQYVQKIRRGAQRLGQLIDDLLAFSRLSRAPLNWDLVDHQLLVKEALEDLRQQRQGRRLEIRVGDLPPGQGDRALLKQVWHHLLANALKFTRPRKKAQVEVGCNLRPGQTVYFVKDNGAGFDMRYAHKLFSAFQRLHRTEEFEGTGMGLAMVHRILQRHGGRIWVEAAVDHGATFFFTLNEGATMPEAHPVEVLLVEDQPQDLELTLRALHKAGVHHRIQVARDGAEALDFLFGANRQANGTFGGLPKVVVLDLKLPKVDGLEVLQELKRHPHTETLPVVILTSSREPQDVARSYQLGVNSYIVKPVDCDGFSSTVQALGRYWLHLNHPPRFLA